MDITKDQDSMNISSSIEMGSKLYKSTPKSDTETTLHFYNFKKRKISYCDNQGTKLEFQQTPSHDSGIINESFTRNFERFQIDQFDDRCTGPAPKFLKTNGCERLVTPPSTPESSAFECTPKKKVIFPRCSSSSSMASPLKEQHDILYPTLKPLDPTRKVLTPQKKRELAAQHCSTPISKRFYQCDKLNRDPLYLMLSNEVVMKKVFSYLSNADLFRVSMVSKAFSGAVYRSFNAKQRCDVYKDIYKKNKENYKITPPSSPECPPKMFPEGSISPNRQNFARFVETGRTLNHNQSLIKCPKCGKPSVVEKSIAQCQEVHSCGFIFCQKCDSFAYNPNDFYDKCQGLVLGNSSRFRPKFEDLTNWSPDFNVSSILSSTVDHYHHASSGYCSGYDSSQQSLVKRNLSLTFGSGGGDASKRPLFASNRSLDIGCKREEKQRVSSSGRVAPIAETGRKKIEVVEPSSPPKIKPYSACSKESRRNLKRLTR